MDQIVAQAMTVYGKIAGVKRKEASALTVPARPSNSVLYPMHIGSGKANGNGNRISKIDTVS
jgi:hypothetical protein